MIKDILEQLAPLDAQIAALKGSGSDMEPSPPMRPNWQSWRWKRTRSYAPAAR